MVLFTTRSAATCAAAANRGLRIEVLEAVRILFGVTNDGPGVVLAPGGVPIPIPGGAGHVFSGTAPEGSSLLVSVAMAHLALLVQDSKDRGPMLKLTTDLVVNEAQNFTARMRKLVELQVPPFVARNLTGLKIEPIHIRNAARGVHDEIRIETREHAAAPLQYRHLGTRMCGDVAAADQYDPVRELIQFQEFLIRDEVFDAWKCERYRPRCGGDQEMSGLQTLAAVDFNSIRSHDLSRRVPGVDSLLPKVLLLFGRNRTGIRALEGHEVAPTDPRVLRDDAPSANS
jgi:hypothetical protein